MRYNDLNFSSGQFLRCFAVSTENTYIQKGNTLASIRSQFSFCNSTPAYLRNRFTLSPTMKTGFFRRYLCGSGGALMDFKEAVLDGAAVWRNATRDALRMKKAAPPVPKWITIPNKDDCESTDSQAGSVDDEEEWRLWFVPKFILEKEFWNDDSSAEDDGLFISDLCCNESSYAPSPRISWQQASY
jgi:hypothetical protein